MGDTLERDTLAVHGGRLLRERSVGGGLGTTGRQWLQGSVLLERRLRLRELAIYDMRSLDAVYSIDWLLD